jgi:hypothetical protein
MGKNLRGSKAREDIYKVARALSRDLSRACPQLKETAQVPQPTKIKRDISQHQLARNIPELNSWLPATQVILNVPFHLPTRPSSRVISRVLRYKSSSLYSFLGFYGSGRGRGRCGNIQRFQPRSSAKSPFHS